MESASPGLIFMLLIEGTGGGGAHSCEFALADIAPSAQTKRVQATRMREALPPIHFPHEQDPEFHPPPLLTSSFFFFPQPRWSDCLLGGSWEEGGFHEAGSTGSPRARRR